MVELFGAVLLIVGKGIYKFVFLLCGDYLPVA
jgi:hypothetical protein